MKDIHRENTTINEEKVGMGESVEFSTDSLPSRKELHGKKKQKTKWKIKFPFVKLVALFFVLLLGTVWVIASQLTKDEAISASSEEKNSLYTESIGEISGFDDEEEAEEDVQEESSGEDIDSVVEKEEENVAASEQKIEEQVEAEKQTVEVSTTETETNDENNKQTTQQTNTSQDKSEVIHHVVQSNENLFRIALKYYSSADGVEIIKQYNGMKNNDIVVGKVLKIPPR